VLIVYIIAFAYTLLLILVLGSSAYNLLRTGVPFVPSPVKELAFVYAELGLNSADVLIDLGSGDGRVCFGFERATAGRAVGVELARWGYYWSRLRAKARGSRAQFLRKNFFNQSWAEATVIYSYTLPQVMAQIGAKARSECRGGTKLISRDFEIPGWQPVLAIPAKRGHTFYIYQI